jgi:amino acid transporter
LYLIRNGKMMGENKPQNKAVKGSKGTLGTFPGVFTPSVLTILGIILFLRLGYVVGNVGLGKALIIIGLANAISVLTSISLSAIATNLKVKVGGPYYIISRTLGAEFGGAIGIVLFLAQSVSIAFYCIGFGEAITAILNSLSDFSPQLFGAFAVSFLLIFAWLGADWGTRFQYVVMILLGAALVSFFAGGVPKWESATFAQNWGGPADGPGFWVLFAVFFPAVTGFTQGVSMSGDLKDAGKSLPLGTFLAVGISIIVYFGVALIFAGALPANILAGDYGAMKRVALTGFLIDAGVIAATLSSAMASFLGAPRILQSLAGDRIFPFLLPFAKGVGPTGNPRRGVLLSAGIAFTTIALGNLNVIAPVVSMFFLISYGLLNYATFYEARSLSPSFRPRFHWFDYRLSLLGFLACLGVMLAIDLTAGAVAISVLFAIYQYLKRTAGPARWADSRRSYHLQLVREHLLAAAKEPQHPRDWRPQVLAFSNHSRRRKQLLSFASWIQGDSGLTTAVRLLEGDGPKMIKLQAEAEAELQRDIRDENLSVFPLVVFAPNLQVTVQTLVQSFGVGPLKANTVLLNWLDQLYTGVLGLKEISYARNLRAAFRRGCNVVVFDTSEEEWKALKLVPSKERRIDVWWWDDQTSRLMLLLAYLITRNDAWEEANVRVLATTYDKKSKKSTEELRKTLEEVRIPAEPEVVPNATADSIVKYSADATLVFLPFRLRRTQLVDPFGNPMEELIPRLPIAAMVLAAEDIDLDAEPEEGKPAEVAAALDAVTDAEKKAQDAEREAVQVLEMAEKAEKNASEVIAAAGPGADKETISNIEKTMEESERAKTQADKAKRKAAKAQAKAEDAAREVEMLGVKFPEEKDQPEKFSKVTKAEKSAIKEE